MYACSHANTRVTSTYQDMPACLRVYTLRMLLCIQCTTYGMVTPVLLYYSKSIRTYGTLSVCCYAYSVLRTVYSLCTGSTKGVLLVVHSPYAAMHTVYSSTPSGLVALRGMLRMLGMPCMPSLIPPFLEYYVLSHALHVLIHVYHWYHCTTGSMLSLPCLRTVLRVLRNACVGVLCILCSTTRSTTYAC